jgi:hypothetical protein
MSICFVLVCAVVWLFERGCYDRWFLDCAVVQLWNEVVMTGGFLTIAFHCYFLTEPESMTGLASLDHQLSKYISASASRRTNGTLHVGRVCEAALGPLEEHCLPNFELVQVGGHATFWVYLQGKAPGCCPHPPDKRSTESFVPLQPTAPAANQVQPRQMWGNIYIWPFVVKHKVWSSGRQGCGRNLSRVCWPRSLLHRVASHREISILQNGLLSSAEGTVYVHWLKELGISEWQWSSCLQRKGHWKKHAGGGP